MVRIDMIDRLDYIRNDNVFQKKKKKTTWDF